MHTITIKGIDFWDEVTEEFISVKTQTITIEHSLVSISKWEQKWHKPYLGSEVKTRAESIDYVRCMTITQHVDPLLYECITPKQMEEINAYISDPMTATWFDDSVNKQRSHDIVTNEVIYGWMSALQIPYDPCQKWHFNRLMTLIRVVNENNQPEKKMSQRDALELQRKLNAKRRAQYKKPR